MSSPNPKPSLLMLGIGLPVILGASLLGFRSRAWTAALAACSLTAITLPMVRGKGKASGSIPGTTADDDGILWEAEVVNSLGQPSPFRITGVTGNAELTLGQASENGLVGSSFWPGHIALEDRERVLAACLSAIQQGQEILRFEYRVPSEQGQPLWIEDSVQVLRAWGGKPRKLRGRMVNVTEQKRAAEILRQSQKMDEVGRLVGCAVHDFNNLLTVIGGHADLVLMSMESTDPRRASLEEIKKAGDRATILARQLLTFSRRHSLSLELLDLGSVVGNLGKVLRRLISEDIELVTAAQAGGGHVLADVGQIEQVIINLVVNARDAMPAGGRLVIETGACDIDQAGAGGMVPSGRYLTLAVTDTGCGMDAATRKRIFEPFFTTKEPGKGTGLGLAMVQEIVRERQGHIEVESEVGKGTRFRIYLPRAESAAAGCPASTTATGVHLGSETVLVVEDEDNVRAMTRQLLRGCGYQVLQSASGEEALRLAETHSGAIDLLLTDVVMPRMNGHDLAEMLKSRRPGLKVVYMSGYERDAILRHAVLDPDTPYIQKPFVPQAMAAVVRRVLDGKPEPHFGAPERELCLVESSSARPN
ncbi:MAG TPA: ATP-binding protein [Terriglobia bacterium]|nr:ATP-binding protein [Terriglobia bacterium]